MSLPAATVFDTVDLFQLIFGHLHAAPLVRLTGVSKAWAAKVKISMGASVVAPCGCILSLDEGIDVKDRLPVLHRMIRDRGLRVCGGLTPASAGVSTVTCVRHHVCVRCSAFSFRCSRCSTCISSYCSTCVGAACALHMLVHRTEQGGFICSPCRRSRPLTMALARLTFSTWRVLGGP